MNDDKRCLRCGQPVEVAKDGWRNGHAYSHADMAICIRALGDAVKWLEQVVLYPERTMQQADALVVDRLGQKVTQEADDGFALGEDVTHLARPDAPTPAASLTREQVANDFSRLARHGESCLVILTPGEAAEIRQAAEDLMGTHSYSTECPCRPCTRLRRALEPLERGMEG